MSIDDLVLADGYKSDGEQKVSMMGSFYCIDLPWFLLKNWVLLWSPDQNSLYPSDWLQTRRDLSDLHIYSFCVHTELALAKCVLVHHSHTWKASEEEALCERRKVL